MKGARGGVGYCNLRAVYRPAARQPLFVSNFIAPTPKRRGYPLVFSLRQ